MLLMLLGIALLVAAAAWWFTRSPPAAPPPRAPLKKVDLASASPPSTSPPPAAAPARKPAPSKPDTGPMDLALERVAPLPGDLPPADAVEAPPPTVLPLRAAELLDPLLTEPLMAALRQLPRPPRAVHELTSPQFLQTATSTELSTLVMGEPAVAARVLATANSPMYGLQQPVHSLGQAITFLGLANVRQMCLQHLLAECFKPRDEAQQREFAVLWRAASVAGELCQQLAPRLRIPEPSQLATVLVLSFLGRQAGASLLPDSTVLAGMDGFERALHEQQELGLPAHELGYLLMRAWELPGELAEDARTLSALRFDPERVVPPDREAALTLGAVCALLGKRIARGDVGAVLFDPAHDPSPEMAALRPRLAKPPLDGLAQELRSPPLLRLLGRLMAAK